MRRVVRRAVVACVVFAVACGSSSTVIVATVELDDARYRASALAVSVHIAGVDQSMQVGVEPPAGRGVRSGDRVGVLLPDAAGGKVVSVTIAALDVVPAPPAPLAGTLVQEVETGHRYDLTVSLVSSLPDLGDAGGVADLGDVVDLGRDGSAVETGDLRATDGLGSDDFAPLPGSDLVACVAQDCALGCGAAAGRCDRPLPVNLAAPPVETSFAEDVVIDADTVLDTATGAAVQNLAAVDLGFRFGVQAGSQPAGAPRLGVFAARTLTVAAGVTLRLIDTANGNPGNAALFVTAGDITVAGTIEVSALGIAMAPGAGSKPGPGGYGGATVAASGAGPAGCGGVSGASSTGGGGGGGASAATGGKGSDGNEAAGGATVMTQATPLAGGCGGGAGDGGNGAPTAGGGGGGAVELSAGAALKVLAGGRVDAAGNGGSAGSPDDAGGGGGGGGMILLEGASVDVAVGALVTTNGGGGAAGGDGGGGAAGGSGMPGPVAVAAAAGGASRSPGGAGGWTGAPEGAAAPAAQSSYGGGGGGGEGRIVLVAGGGTVAAGATSGAVVQLPVTQTY